MKREHCSAGLSVEEGLYYYHVEILSHSLYVANWQARHNRHSKYLREALLLDVILLAAVYICCLRPHLRMSIHSIYNVYVHSRVL